MAMSAKNMRKLIYAIRTGLVFGKWALYNPANPETARGLLLWQRRGLYRLHGEDSSSISIWSTDHHEIACGPVVTHFASPSLKIAETYFGSVAHAKAELDKELAKHGAYFEEWGLEA